MPGPRSPLAALLALAAASVLVLAACAGAQEPSRQGPPPSTTLPFPTTPTSPPRPPLDDPETTEPEPPLETEPEPSGLGPGTYDIGVDIKPGTYVSAGAVDTVCYWARLRSFDGSLDAIIANNSSDEGRQRVTIRRSDKGFETSGCAPWTRQR